MTTTHPLLFLRKLLRHGTRVASFAPSSETLARELCRLIDPLQPQMILELGAGTGAVTRIAAQRMHRSSQLFAVEIDPDFAAIARQQVPQAEILEVDASYVRDLLAMRGIEQVDVVISGLPVPSLPFNVNNAVFQAFQALAPNGVFSQLTVMPWVYLNFYRRLFHDVHFVPIWRNLPPGGVYHCAKLRSDFAANLPYNT
jgi:phosphatidylethanolamine/phosphatidyl-N-methylethanolamine N-methyltransferase